MTKTLIIVGTSEAVAAEYSYRAEAAFTVLELYDGEPVATMGFHTMAAALAEANTSQGEGVTVQVL